MVRQALAHRNKQCLYPSEQLACKVFDGCMSHDISMREPSTILHHFCLIYMLFSEEVRIDDASIEQWMCGMLKEPQGIASVHFLEMEITSCYSQNSQ